MSHPKIEAWRTVRKAVSAEAMRSVRGSAEATGLEDADNGSISIGFRAPERIAESSPATWTEPARPP